MLTSRKKVLILGGGTAGIALAAKLRRMDSSLELVLVEPHDTHYYQPLWTLAAAGLATKEETGRPMKDLIPKGVEWLQDQVSAIHPQTHSVELSNGRSVSYDYLVVATGLQLDWNSVEGLKEQLGQHGICSVYQYDQVDYTQKCIKEFTGGKALFVMPPVPIKCAGAPQKIMYLAEHVWRKRGVREGAHLQFLTAGKAMFGIPVFAETLKKIIDERGIEALFQHRLVAVDGAKKQALFEYQTEDGTLARRSYSFDLLHVVPKMSAHSFISASGLAVEEGDQKGWLAVDKYTLQHLKFKNIFGIGDVTGIPNSKTGAAIRKQYPIVAQNIFDVMAGKEPSQAYDGYSSCPLITEIGKVMLAEFGYNGKLMPSFPLDPAQPRRIYWYLKKDLLPLLYWGGMMRGLV